MEYPVGKEVWNTGEIKTIPEQRPFGMTEIRIHITDAEKHLINGDPGMAAASTQVARAMMQYNMMVPFTYGIGGPINIIMESEK